MTQLFRNQNCKFKKQVENITNLINGNFTLTMQEINGLKKGNQ